MEFSWDDEKRRKNLLERNVDLLYAAQIFENPILVACDRRKDYGELRWIAVGEVDDECFVVIYANRDDTIRLITAWKGGRRDKRKYQESLARRPQGTA